MGRRRRRTGDAYQLARAAGLEQLGVARTALVMSPRADARRVHPDQYLRPAGLDLGTLLSALGGLTLVVGSIRTRIAPFLTRCRCWG